MDTRRKGHKNGACKPKVAVFLLIITKKSRIIVLIRMFGREKLVMCPKAEEEVDDRKKHFSVNLRESHFNSKK